MTKSQFMEALSSKSGMAKKDVVNFMNVLADMAYSEVKRNGEFIF